MFTKLLNMLSSIDKLFLFESGRFDPDELAEDDHELMIDPNSYDPDYY